MRLAFVPAGVPQGMSAHPEYSEAIAAALRCLGHDAFLAASDTWRTLDAAMPLVVDAAVALGRETDDLAGRGAVAVVVQRADVDGTRDPCGAGAADAAATERLGRFGRLIATSEATATLLRAQPGLGPEAIRVVPPGVAERPRSPGSGGPGCAILAIAPAGATSGTDVLLRALARLFDLDWRLIIVGGIVPESLPLQTLAEELGIANRIILAATPSPQDLETLWAGTDMLAIPAPQDGYGRWAAEALRRGIPVAMVGSDDLAALLSPDAGVACVPGDRDTLSKSLRRMIFDTALRGDMAETAWRIGRGLPDWPTQARAFLAAIGA